MGKHGDKKVNAGHSSANTNSYNNPIEKTSLSAHAQLQRAVERFVDVGAFPQFAPRLPCNTMSSSLCNSVNNTLSNSHGQRTYIPIPLTDENSYSNQAETDNSLVRDYIDDNIECRKDVKCKTSGTNSNYNNSSKTD